MLQSGDTAPDFELRSHRGGTVKLSSLRGKRVVVAFHPLAFTPVCATQMQSYQADVKRFEHADTAVLGLSIDAQPSKAAWAKELGVTSFDLLSDNYPYGAVAQKYGVFRQKDANVGGVALRLRAQLARGAGLPCLHRLAGATGIS